MEYVINKGVDQPIVLAGIKGRYIFILAIGVVVAFVCYFLFQIFSQILGFMMAGLVAGGTYLYSSYMSAKHGVNGLAFLTASRMTPDRIQTKRSVRLIQVED